MGEKQEPEVLGEDGFPVEPGEGETAPEPLNAPAKTGEGDEGEGAGEGEGSEKQGGAWSKDKADITRLQQEKAEMATKLSEAEKREAYANARVELSRRQGADPAKESAKDANPEDEAAWAALNRISKQRTGKSFDELVANVSQNAAGVGNAAVAAMDATMRADPDAYPYYEQVRENIMQYAQAEGKNMTPAGYRFAYSELERPLAKADRKTRMATAAKGKATRRASIDGAPLPGGGRSAGGGVGGPLSKAEIGALSDDDLDDYLANTEMPDLE